MMNSSNHLISRTRRKSSIRIRGFRFGSGLKFKRNGNTIAKFDGVKDFLETSAGLLYFTFSAGKEISIYRGEANGPDLARLDYLDPRLALRFTTSERKFSITWINPHGLFSVSSAIQEQDRVVGKFWANGILGPRLLELWTDLDEEAELLLAVLLSVWRKERALQEPVASRSVLHRAGRASSDHVSHLLAAGEDPRSKDNFGRTPLHFFAKEGSLENVKLLLAAGANVNAETKNGWTPLHEAAKYGVPEMVLALLEAGADPNLKTHNGQSPSDLAKENKNLCGTQALNVLEKRS